MPRYEPDFTGVTVAVPIYPKGRYELAVESVKGSAWDKTDDKTGETTLVKRVGCRVTMVGAYDSKGKLKTAVGDMKDIAGKPVRNLDLYIHSEGAMRMAKGHMMAILGFNPRNEEHEQQFNEWIKSNGISFSFDAEPSEDGEGYGVTLGNGWETLAGKRFVALLDKEIYKPEGGEPRENQVFSQVLPSGTVS